MTIPALIPPFRFNIVEHALYRGSYPTLKNFRFLKRLKLRTIISVTPEPPTTDLLEFCHHEHIQNLHFTAEKFTSDNVTVSSAMVCNILQILIDSSNLPLYIHCLDGANVTGIIIMILRKLQNWTKIAIVSEFCRFTRDHSVEKNESEFLALYSEEVEVPAIIPSWLWGGKKITKHPSLVLVSTDTIANGLEQVDASLSSSSIQWESGCETTEIYLRQLDTTRVRTNEGSEGDPLQTVQGEFQDHPIPRSLTALDLAGL